jgi:hypothetical protein
VLDGDDYYIDLRFFHRRMRRLIAIELKIGDFKPADSGQMELYLRWLDRHERQHLCLLRRICGRCFSLSRRPKGLFLGHSYTSAQVVEALGFDHEVVVVAGAVDPVGPGRPDERFRPWLGPFRGLAPQVHSPLVLFRRPQILRKSLGVAPSVRRKTDA